MTIADASFLIDLMRGDPGARAALQEARARRESIRLPTVVLQELVYGARRHSRPEDQEARLKRSERAFRVLAFKSDHARRAGELEVELERRGAAGGDVDVQVAATALVEDAEVLTRDKRFPSVEGVRVRRY